MGTLMGSIHQQRHALIADQCGGARVGGGVNRARTRLGGLCVGGDSLSHRGCGVGVLTVVRRCSYGPREASHYAGAEPLLALCVCVVWSPPRRLVARMCTRPSMNESRGA